MLRSEAPEAFTILIEIDCKHRTLAQQYALFAGDPAAVFRPIRSGGKDCFLLMYGVYHEFYEAEAALNLLPDSMLDREAARRY